MEEDRDELDQFFEDNNINKIIKRSKLKQRIKMVGICISVIGGLLVINDISCRVMSNQIYRSIQDRVALSIPNGYISDIDETRGLFNVRVDYTVSKNLLYKNIEIEKDVFQKGNYYNSIHTSRWYTKEEERWKSGSKKIEFFHPKLKYSTYKNEVALFKQMPRGQVAELGLSFDKAYTWNEVQNLLKEYPIQWLWIDIYNDKMLGEIQDEMNQTESIGIVEDKVIGINLWEIGKETNYDSVLSALNKSKKDVYKQAYQVMKERDYSNLENIQFIGAIIIVNEEEAINLSKCKEIKAISVGATANKY